MGVGRFVIDQEAPHGGRSSLARLPDPGRSRRPVKEFLDKLSDEDAAEVAAAMSEARTEGLIVARHLRGEIYEVRAEGRDVTIRILFAPEGKKGRILLALEGFKKKTQRTPPQVIKLAERRLADWRSRAS